MEYEIVEREVAERSKKQSAKRGWSELLSSLTWDKAIRISYPDKETLRRNQPRLYEAAGRCRKQIETFTSVEDGHLVLNIWLRNP